MTAMPKDDVIKTRYEDVMDRVAKAADRSGRKGEAIHVVAVTKNAAFEQVRELIVMGHRDFGESRMQHFLHMVAQVDEYLERQRSLGDAPGTTPDQVRWHFIGHLQRNKVRRVLPASRLLHSVDSLRLAEEIQAATPQEPIEVLIQANISGERTKYGIAPAAIEHMIEQIDTMLNLRVRGMMCMAPKSEDPEDARRTFIRCQEIFEEICQLGIAGNRFDILSMGMSDDYEVAIECGANMVRVGRAIFGEVEPTDLESPEAALQGSTDA
jgi:pyridoxal phosphate enzyme (YggS family)